MPPGTVLPFLLQFAQWTPPAWVRRYGLLVWVLLAATLGLAVLLGCASPLLAQRPYETVLMAGAVVCAAMAWRARRAPGFMVVARGTTIGWMLIAVAAHTLAGYVVLIPCAGVAAGLLLVARGNTAHPEARWFITVLSMWFPLLWAPAIGPWWAWRRALRGPRRDSE